MKNYVIAAIISLFVTAWVFDTKAPPVSLQAGINGVSPAADSNMRKMDGLIGEVQVTDESRSIKYATAVSDKVNDKQEDPADLPYWSNN